MTDKKTFCSIFMLVQIGNWYYNFIPERISTVKVYLYMRQINNIVSYDYCDCTQILSFQNTWPLRKNVHFTFKKLIWDCLRSVYKIFKTFYYALRLRFNDSWAFTELLISIILAFNTWYIGFILILISSLLYFLTEFSHLSSLIEYGCISKVHFDWIQHFLSIKIWSSGNCLIYHGNNTKNIPSV